MPIAYESVSQTRAYHPRGRARHTLGRRACQGCIGCPGGAHAWRRPGLGGMGTPPKAAFSLGPTSFIKWQPYAQPWRWTSLAALGMHARDTFFRVIYPPTPTIGVQDYYRHTWDAVMLGVRNRCPAERARP